MVIQIAKKIHGFETLRKLTVGELLWGYKSRVIDWARTLQEPAVPRTSCSACWWASTTPCRSPYTMHTGKGDAAKMNQIIAWNGRERLDLLERRALHEIRGTDANGFAPGCQQAGHALHLQRAAVPRDPPRLQRHRHPVGHRRLPLRAATTTSSPTARPTRHNNCYCSGEGLPALRHPGHEAVLLGRVRGLLLPALLQGGPQAEAHRPWAQTGREETPDGVRHLSGPRGSSASEAPHADERDAGPQPGPRARAATSKWSSPSSGSRWAWTRCLARWWDFLKLGADLPPVVKTTSVNAVHGPHPHLPDAAFWRRRWRRWCGWGSSGASKRPHTPRAPPGPPPLSDRRRRRGTSRTCTSPEMARRTATRSRWPPAFLSPA
uniref:Scavenger receptor class B member 1-like protein n=1 Tax=Penaeus penicillatus TaxID=161924 RepID=A0A4P8PLL8_PENPN|nr:scavenger receptor class B member 1-like protein [Penaeus penicillatus]